MSDSQSKNTIQVNAFEVSPVEVDGSIQSRKHLLCQNLILLIGVIVAKRWPQKHNEAEPKCYKRWWPSMAHIFLWSVKLNTLEVRCTFNTIEGILYYLLIIKRPIENPLKNKKNWYNASSRVGRRVE